MTINELKEILKEVSYDANYEFVHCLFEGSFFISSYYNTGSSFIIQLDSSSNYKLNRFRNIIYLQKNVPIIIQRPPNLTNTIKLPVDILNIEYDSKIEKLTIVFD
jgi:hypothetical protein